MGNETTTEMRALQNAIGAMLRAVRVMDDYRRLPSPHFAAKYDIDDDADYIGQFLDGTTEAARLIGLAALKSTKGE